MGDVGIFCVELLWGKKEEERMSESGLKLTQYHVVLRDALTAVHPIKGNLFDGFLAKGSHPNTEICGHHVHQTEPSQELELVNVQLQIEKKAEDRLERCHKESAWKKVHKL